MYLQRAAIALLAAAILVVAGTAHAGSILPYNHLYFHQKEPLTILVKAPSHGKPKSSHHKKANIRQGCWEEAGRTYGVSPWLLYSIAYVESRFDPEAINRNRNGSVDYSLMQINSQWYPTLKRHGIDMQDLKNPCLSIKVGAWIMAQNLRTYGYTWRAIGAYNSSNPAIQLRYARKVYAAEAMLADRATQ